MKLSVACLAASVLLAAAPSMAQVVAPPDPDQPQPPLHAPNGRWAAKGWADRIVLSPAADAARG
ncbi:MAG: hydrolase, partial [Proteobacteria bacterium]|nr:hydrolase [Pseudomonadota bacterium]